MKYLLCLLLTGCSTIPMHRGELCIKSKQLTFTVPLDSLPHKHECKSKEVLDKFLNFIRR